MLKGSWLWRRQHCLMKIYAAALICVNNARQQRQLQLRHRIPTQPYTCPFMAPSQSFGHGANDLAQALTTGVTIDL